MIANMVGTVKLDELETTRCVKLGILFLDLPMNMPSDVHPSLLCSTASFDIFDVALMTIGIQ